MTSDLKPVEPAESVARQSLCAVHGSVSGRTHLDLFSGIGGFALAAQQTGWETIAFAETDEHASQTLKRHWPQIPNLGDVRNVRGITADLITGGIPCQPYSTAGKQLGANDPRALWPEMLRIIREGNPTWILVENVAGFVNMALDEVCADLEGEGYEVWPLVIPACGLDARHRRNRLWIMAHAVSVRELQPEGGEREQWRRSSNCRAPMADTDETGRREQRRTGPMAAEYAEIGRAHV